MVKWNSCIPRQSMAGSFVFYGSFHPKRSPYSLPRREARVSSRKTAFPLAKLAQSYDCAVNTVFWLPWSERNSGPIIFYETALAQGQVLYEFRMALIVVYSYVFVLVKFGFIFLRACLQSDMKSVHPRSV